MGLLGDYLPDWLPADPDKAEAAKMGLLNFGAAMMSARGGNFGTSLGAGLQAGAQGYQAAYKSALDQKKENMQMDLLKQQVAQSTRKNELVNGMLAQYGLGGGQSSVSPSPKPISGQLGGGLLSSVDSPSGTTTAPATPNSMANNGIVNGVPVAAIAHDLAFNDGKGIGEWMYKQGIPNMQVHNGNAIDMNKVKPGFLPGINVSQNGQATVTAVGPDGSPVVYAPPGAVATYKAYQNAGKEADARYTPLDPDKFVPRDGSAPKRTVLDYVTPNEFPSISPQVQRQRDSAALELARQDVANATSPQDKETAQKVLNDMSARYSAGQSVISGSAKSSGDVMTPAEKEASVGRVKADNAVREARLKDAQSTENIQKMNDAKTVISLLDTAYPLLDKASGSIVGSGLTSAANAVGLSTDAAKANAELRVLEGALVSRMPKMSGPQSDKDVLLYKQMAGVIGDPLTPADNKKAAVKIIRNINEKYLGDNANLNSILKPAIPSMDGSSASSQKTTDSTPNLLPELPKANGSNNGKTAIDHETGKRFRSNGLQWVEVK